jgi:hypothetical protein
VRLEEFVSNCEDGTCYWAEAYEARQADYFNDLNENYEQIEDEYARLLRGIGYIPGFGPLGDVDGFNVRQLTWGFFVYTLHGGKGEVLYVGQSTNVLSRLGNHLGETKKRNEVHHVSLIKCDSKLTMNQLEARMIKLEQPPWNRNGK